MVQYKTVAGPAALTLEKKQNWEEAIRPYAAIIQREAVGGWELHSIQQIPITKKAGCFSAILSFIPVLNIFARSDITLYYNMLIFVKRDD